MVKIRNGDARIKREWVTPRISPPQRNGLPAVEGLSGATRGLFGLTMALFSLPCARMSGAKGRLGRMPSGFPYALKRQDYCL